MIHAYAILTGYIALRGSSVIHFSMLVAMIVFVRIPPDEELLIAFPGGEAWYFYALFMHLILGFLHFTTMIQTIDAVETFKEGLLMCAVLAEVLNFVTMLSLFAEAPMWSDMTSEERLFEIWLFVEALVIMGTVLVNVIYVFIRSFYREGVDLSLEGDVQ